jgi:hypothetical protein
MHVKMLSERTEMNLKLVTPMATDGISAKGSLTHSMAESLVQELGKGVQILA